jgi:hypothetical protein
MPTRGRALPFVATSLRHISLGKEASKPAPLAVSAYSGNVIFEKAGFYTARGFQHILPILYSSKDE